MDLHRHGATGSLKVDGPSYQKALYYRGGRILFGSSNDPRDQLGSIMIEDGKISPEQLEDVNSKVGPGNPLAKALAESGFVNQRELGEAARAKVERILSDVIAYETGSFEFEDGVLPKGAVDLKLSTERLVLAAVRRVTDRNFVLLHLGGMDTVLAPSEDQTALDEIRGEVGGLAPLLDGARTLKDATAATRLDEFDAAKVACALLFLGIVHPAEPGEGGEFMAAGGLDLAGTAASAVDEALPETVIMAAPHELSAPSETEPDFSVPADAEETHEAPAFVVPEPEEAPAAVAVPEPEPEPEPEIAVAPPRPAPSRSALPLKPPPPRHAPEPPSIPIPAPPSTARPSREDLAALDALLNTRSAEGPLEPFEKERAPGRDWEPSFGAAKAPRARRAQSGLKPVLLGVAAVVLLGGAAGAWYLLRGEPASGSRSAAKPTAAPPTAPVTASPATTLPGATVSPAATAAASPSAGPVAATPIPGPSPTLTAASSAPPTPAPKSVPAAASVAGARGFLLKGDLPQAALTFAASMKASPASDFSIQILVACSDETVQKALQNVSAPELFIVPVNFKGRDCYRVCWGLYESDAKAAAALHEVPEYFRKGGATPKVVPARTILP
jgi:hypothetical protein